jgi:predicted component of type VI protein secretion system
MKLTKEQQYAIEGLLVMLDELEDKPRRLYRALEDLALAFNKTGAIPSIREAQDFMYEHLSQGNIYSCLFSSLREFTKSSGGGILEGVN